MHRDPVGGVLIPDAVRRAVIPAQKVVDRVDIRQRLPLYNALQNFPICVIIHRELVANGFVMQNLMVIPLELGVCATVPAIAAGVIIILATAPSGEARAQMRINKIQKPPKPPIKNKLV